MPRFAGSDFAIELPEEYTDESTYAFAFPGSGGFRPSVVVKTERLTVPVPLATFVLQQMEKLEAVLPRMEVVTNEAMLYGTFPARRCVYDWGDPSRRVRQIQRHILLEGPARVVTLTGTALLELFPQTEALFEATFDSYRSLAEQRL